MEDSIRSAFDDIDREMSGNKIIMRDTFKVNYIFIRGMMNNEYLKEILVEHCSKYCTNNDIEIITSRFDTEGRVDFRKFFIYVNDTLVQSKNQIRTPIISSKASKKLSKEWNSLKNENLRSSSNRKYFSFYVLKY